MKKLILFDFDGTIAHLFKNYDLSLGAKRINEILIPYGYKLNLKNPFEAYFVLEKDKEALRLADEIVEEAENEAVKSLEKVAYFDEYFLKFKEEYEIAIVTNNSKSSVERFFHKEFGDYCPFIVGRDGLHPKTLKPSPNGLILALNHFNIEVKDSLFVGDGIADLTSAKSIGMDFIAMGSMPHKYKRFVGDSYPLAIVHDFKEFYLEVKKLCAIS